MLSKLAVKDACHDQQMHGACTTVFYYQTYPSTVPEYMARAEAIG